MGTHACYAYLPACRHAQTRAHTHMMLIDLDASCNIGGLAGQKVTSSAFFPPEVAGFELEKLQGGTSVTGIIATEKLEMWYFGLLLLQLCTKDAPTLWQSTQADTILHSSDMELLAYMWDTIKLERIRMSLQEAGQEWVTAMDLALWCLQGVAARRPCSMETVFKHKLFDSTGALRFLQCTDESWDELVGRQAAALHTAINCKDSMAVEGLFLLGGVHIDMLHDSFKGCTIRPLHRAAFTGDSKVLCVLINEMPSALPDSMKSKILDCRTELGYTPYMLACKCGHTKAAQMLVEAGCNDALMNSSQRTGKKLADVFQREAELSGVHPWSRGDLQHLVATSLESFLDMAKAALNEHVCAGMNVWNSKQMVWKFSKEQMQALQKIIKQLVCRMCAHMAPRMWVCVRTQD